MKVKMREQYQFNNKETRFLYVDWINVAQVRIHGWAVLNTIMEFRVP
jgi:hypothetical protein